MPNLLCIETATAVCSVAVFQGKNLLAVQEIADGNQHASQLAVLIQQTLLNAGLTAKQLDAVVISKGPGSYTGLRVGVSTAKGICYALNKPLIAINTLKSMAYSFVEQHKPETGLICPMIDARRMEVYTALFDVKGNEVMETQAKIIEPDSFAKFADHEIMFIGNGAQKCKGIINHAKAKFINGFNCSALGLGLSGLVAFNNNNFENVAYFEPYYLKDFVGTTAKKAV